MRAPSGSIDIAGVRLETAWHGPPPEAAPTLVLLHEGLGSVSTWGRFPEQLAAATGYGVFVYSRRGYGRSDPVPLPRSLRYMHEEALDVLPAVLAAIGFRRGVLVGHSDGASIALIHAGGRIDQRVRGLIAMAPHVFVEEEGLAGIRATASAYAQGDLRERLERHHGPNVETAFAGWRDAWLDQAFLSWDLREYLPHIRVPVLQIQGEGDQYGTRAQLEAIEALTTCPVETVLIRDCGHSPHREQLPATLAPIADFLHRLLVVHG